MAGPTHCCRGAGEGRQGSGRTGGPTGKHQRRDIAAALAECLSYEELELDQSCAGITLPVSGHDH